MSCEGGHRLVAKPGTIIDVDAFQQNRIEKPVLVRRWVVPQLVGVAERLEGPLAT